MVLRRWEYYKIIWFYKLSWQCKLATVKSEGLTLETSAFESLYGGQFTLSTQLIKPNYLVLLTLSWFQRIHNTVSITIFKVKSRCVMTSPKLTTSACHGQIIKGSGARRNTLRRQALFVYLDHPSKYNVASGKKSGLSGKINMAWSFSQ